MVIWRVASRRHRNTLVGEGGASLVEFAVILPLLILLMFGVMEASWAFYKQNDIRFGAREGARIAAVEDTWTVAQIGAEVCARMDSHHAAQPPTVTLELLSADGNQGGLAGIEVASDLKTITGLLDGVFGGVTLESAIEFRIEQPTSGTAQWWQDIVDAGATTGTYTCS